MSGHSHWHSIRHQKGITDAKRGKIFSKISRLISVAAKKGGADPETNLELRAAIGRAKELNVPKDNIERAIKRGTGQLEGAQIEEVIYSLDEKDREMYDKIIKIFKAFQDKESVVYKYLNKEIKFLVRKNILFANPVDKILKPQSKLDLLALRSLNWRA